MKKILALSWLFLFSVNILSAQTPFAIIPKPKQLTPQKGSFEITSATKIVFSTENADLINITNQLNLRFRIVTGSPLETTNAAQGKNIYFVTKEGMAAEAYMLDIDPSKITITASQAIGHFYGMQTLLQLLPPTIYSSSPQTTKWIVPACKIIDEPRFSYRGSMLDVGRHFFSVDFIKKYIDLLALHKMNTFHWHLTEDQGWRIEIKKYPKLTEIGSTRAETMKGHYSDQTFDGKPYGGFYTQEQIREVVKYAQSKYVTVIPEIEMPGHALAALASYPELGCTGGPYKVGTRWGVYDEVYCPTEKTFEFLENVLTEVLDLFPSQYIHIGGDECPKTSWEKSEFCQNLIKAQGLKDEHELQSYFIRRIDKFLTSKGRKMIGWDEILEGGISPNATIMSWRGIEGGIAAAKQKHDAIMTPTSNCYLDYYQGDKETEPLAIGGFLPLDKVYNYEPIPTELSAEERKHILGTQGNLWTEYIPTSEQAEYMAYPRLSALAEVAWTHQLNKNYPDFSNRLTAAHFERLAHLGVNFAKTYYDITFQTGVYTRGESIVKLASNDKSGTIRYTIDGTQPNASSLVYKDAVQIPSDMTVMAALFDKEGKQIGKTISKYFHVTKSTGRPYTLANQPKTYTGGETYGLSNGIRGTQANTTSWVGFEGKDLDATFDYGRSQNFTNVTIGFLNNPKQWIHAPRYVEVLVSEDGKTFTSVKKVEVSSAVSAYHSVKQMNVSLGTTINGRYIKIMAKNFGEIPQGYAGAGKSAWLFVDEIGIE